MFSTVCFGLPGHTEENCGMRGLDEARGLLILAPTVIPEGSTIILLYEWELTSASLKNTLTREAAQLGCGPKKSCNGVSLLYMFVSPLCVLCAGDRAPPSNCWEAAWASIPQVFLFQN